MPVDFACSSTMPGEAKIPDPIVVPTINNTADDSPMVLSSVLSFTISASVVADSGGASGCMVDPGDSNECNNAANTLSIHISGRLPKIKCKNNSIDSPGEEDMIEGDASSIISMLLSGAGVRVDMDDPVTVIDGGSLAAMCNGCIIISPSSSSSAPCANSIRL